MLDVIRHTCPFPTIDAEGELHDGLFIGQARRCTRCATCSCKHRLVEKEGTAPRHAVCEFGFSTVIVPTRFGNLLLNGLFVPFQNEKMVPASRKANLSQMVV